MHTPYSALNNGFGNSFDAYAQRLIRRAVDLDIAAVGVTDYFSISGYSDLRALMDDRERLETVVGSEYADAAQEILLLPSIEFRASVIVQGADGTDSRVNYHVIFSDELRPADIEEYFLRELRFTAQGDPDNPDERWSLTLANLAALGARLKAEHQPFEDESDLFIGMMNAVVSHEDVTEVLERQASRFRDRYLFVVPSDEDLSTVRWDGQGHLAKKVFIQKSHMLFSANAGTRAFGLGERHTEGTGAFLAEFKSFKPCIHGSDAHAFESLFQPDGNRHTWIKADPTFRGLQQLLYEPADRVFIGETPPALAAAAARPTRIVSDVAVVKVPGSTLGEAWFDFSLPLNSGLTVVIGNKGSGKSALADVIALLGNTQRTDAFSFLGPGRFRRAREGKAEHFEATLTWADETTSGPRKLSENPDPAGVERVRYIPQNYLEEICNEIGSGRRSRFYAELQQVIFSHVPSPERLGFSALQDLLDHLGDGINGAVAVVEVELREVNRQLARLISRSRPDEEWTLQERLTEKRRELDAHERAQPPAMPLPEEDAATREQTAQVRVLLDTRQSELQVVVDALNAIRNEAALVLRRRSIAERLLGIVRNLRRQVAASLDDLTADWTELGLTRDEVIALHIEERPHLAIAEATVTRLGELERAVDPEVDGSEANRRDALQEHVAELEAQLSAPQQQYQTYLRRTAEWTAARDEIIGGNDLPGTIRYLEAALEELARLPDRIAGLELQRDDKTREIYEEKQRLRRHYETYHRPVEEFLQRHPLAGTDFELSFQTSIRETDLAGRFLRMVHRGRVGPFSGVDEGSEVLQRLMETTDWESGESVLDLARPILQLMTAPNDGGPLQIADQLVQGASVEGLLDLLFSLDYLEPVYELKWAGKGVEELSPGERGNLLLIFYFLIDREDIPLLIDQPEENLDNQTVVRTLVRCIKDAKNRRQMIVVTHNPNLAVVCDADQVIYCEIHKEAGNRVRYESGSIEEPTINQRILDVLEGTRPAFDKREARYID